jgi:hypothetical protein
MQALASCISLGRFILAQVLAASMVEHYWFDVLGLLLASVSLFLPDYVTPSGVNVQFTQYLGALRSRSCILTVRFGLDALYYPPFGCFILAGMLPGWKWFRIVRGVVTLALGGLTVAFYFAILPKLMFGPIEARIGLGAILHLLAFVAFGGLLLAFVVLDSPLLLRLVVHPSVRRPPHPPSRLLFLLLNLV